MKGGGYMDMQNIIGMLSDLVTIGTGLATIMYYIDVKKNHSSKEH